jgi:outer membrane protein TolC
VLNAETQVLTARQSMVDIQTGLAVSRVTLLLAVGGSFDARAAGDRADARTPATSTEATSRELVTRIDP